MSAPDPFKPSSSLSSHAGQFLPSLSSVEQTSPSGRPGYGPSVTPLRPGEKVQAPSKGLHPIVSPSPTLPSHPCPFFPSGSKTNCCLDITRHHSLISSLCSGLCLDFLSSVRSLILACIFSQDWSSAWYLPTFTQ